MAYVSQELALRAVGGVCLQDELLQIPLGLLPIGDIRDQTGMAHILAGGRQARLSIGSQ